MVSKKLNIACAIFCFLSFSCGVACSVIVSKLMNFMIEKDSYIPAFFAQLWIIGFAYIVPGAIGILATALRKKISYNLHSGLGLSAVIILAVLYFLGLISTRQTSANTFCKMHAGTCTCENSQLLILLKFFSCDDINYLVRMGMSSDAMFFGGGIVTLISAIMSICLGSSLVNRPQQRNTTSGIDLSEMNINGTEHQSNQSGTVELNKQPVLTSVTQAFVSLFKN